MAIRSHRQFPQGWLTHAPVHEGQPFRLAGLKLGCWTNNCDKAVDRFLYCTANAQRRPSVRQQPLLQPLCKQVFPLLLQGPYYVNPLMSFIDERCLIFTPEEENKLEYTGVRIDVDLHVVTGLMAVCSG